MEEITLTNAQKQVDDWANQFKKPYFSPLSQLAALIEEVGEVARVLNRMYGDKPAKDTENIKDLEEEINDLFFSVLCLANAEKVNLTEGLTAKFNKLNLRDANRWEKK